MALPIKPRCSALRSKRPYLLNMEKLLRNILFVMIFIVMFDMVGGEVGDDESASVEQEEQRLVEESHLLDSINLLIFMFLLTLTILTVWLFKQKRFRYVHETGLAMIYGLIAGAVITYISPAEEIPNYLLPGTNLTVAPAAIWLQLSNESTYRYDLKGRVYTHKAFELQEKATFDPEIFFNVLLPPIIFHAGYSLKRLHFFRNFGSILTFAFFGTIISCFSVGAVIWVLTKITPHTSFAFIDCLFFGALISATDPVTVLAVFHDLHVDVTLYALVFGESVLNDAVAIVLSQSIDLYSSSSGGFNSVAFFGAFGNFIKVFIGAFALGSLVGMITAAITKFTRLREHPLLETTLFFTMSYSTFAMAEAFHLTGIVSMLFCGVTQAHYTYHNLSEESKLRTKQIFEILNFLAENFIFCYMGVSVFTFQDHQWNASFIVSAIFAILIARIINIYPLSFLLNLLRRHKIKYNLQHMMTFSGLRGAIAFALAIRNTSTVARQTFFTTTLMIVLLTVILIGGISSQMLQWLGIKTGVEEEQQSVSPRLSPSATEEARRRQSNYEKARLVRIWSNFDYKLLKPLFTNQGPPLTQTLPKCCLPLARLLTVSPELLQSREDSDTDLILNNMDDGNNMHPGSASMGDRLGNSTIEGGVHMEDVSLEGDLGLGDPEVRGDMIGETGGDPV